MSGVEGSVKPSDSPPIDYATQATALREAADAYQFGGWIAARRIARRDLTPDGVSQWLRDRADRLATAAPSPDREPEPTPSEES